MQNRLRSLLFFLLLLYSNGAAAQWGFQWEEERMFEADSGNAFCQRLYTVLDASREQFRCDRDTVCDSSAASGKVWKASERITFGAAHTCRVEKHHNRVRYRAIFLSGDREGPVLASYNNLLERLKECMPANYEFVSRKGIFRRIRYTYLKQPEDMTYKIPVIRIWVNHYRSKGVYQLVMEIEDPVF